jgi:broad specificity polyphosphatase/5'/3'-nucleotidase SurE
LGLEARTEPYGNTYFWYSFERHLSTPHKGTDIEAIMQGNISITPLHMDHTSVSLTKKLVKLF